MKIAFNGMYCGFGNQGGTQTNFRTANKLASFGHEVYIYSTSCNQFTWFPLDPKVKYIETKVIPKEYFDIVFMCGFKTYESTLLFNSKVKINWIRGWETWSNDKNRILKICQNKNLIQWTNSEWIQTHLKLLLGIEVDVMYPGIPIEHFWDDLSLANNYDGITIGFLNSSVHSSPKKGFKTSLKIAKGVKPHGVRIVGYGNTPKQPIYDYYTQRPDLEEKRKIYNMCDLWIVTSTNEGLHIPPMEAGLCEVPSLIPTEKQCGCYDWYTGSPLKYDVPGRAIDYIKRAKDFNLKQLGKDSRDMICCKIGSVTTAIIKMMQKLESYT